MKKIKFKNINRNTLVSWNMLLEYAIEHPVDMGLTGSDYNKLTLSCIQELHQKLSYMYNKYDIKFTFSMTYPQAIAFKILVTRNRFLILKSEEIAINQIIAQIDQKTV